MKPALPILLLALGLAVVAGPGAAAQSQEDDDIYVCRDRNGEIIAIQVDPCPELPEPKPAPVAAPKPKPAPVVSPAETRPPNSKLSHAKTRPLRWKRVTPGPARRSIPANLGRQTFPTRLPAAGTAPAPGYTSPERTWRTLLAATRNNDPAAAAACFTPTALAQIGPLDGLQKMLAGFTRIESEGPVGPFWSIYGVRPGQRPKWILFEQTKPGEWKIAGM